MLNACANARLRIGNDGEEAIDVCEAIQAMMDEAAEEAVQEERALSIKNMMKNLSLTAEQAMDAIGVPEEERDAVAALI